MYENQSMSTQASRTLDHKETFHGLPTGNTLPGFSVTLPDHDDELSRSFAVSSATEQFSPAHSFWKPLETHSDLQPARDCEKDSNLGDISNLWHSYFETGDHLPTLGSFLHSKHPPTIDHFHPNFSQTHCSASSTAPNSLKVIPSESIIDDNVVCTYRPPTNITSYGSAVEPSHFVVRKNSFESSETCNESEDTPSQPLDLLELSTPSARNDQIPRYHPDTEIAKYLSPSTKNCTTTSATLSPAIEDAREAFTRLVSSLNSVPTSHFGIFLVNVLKECHDPVPLDDFYCAIYGRDHVTDIPTLDYQTGNTDRPISRERLKALNLQRLVLESFKKPRKYQYGFLQNMFFCAVNYHELQRSFLAVKILFEFIEKVEDKTQTLPRLSLYKVYCILCQKLIHKHPEISIPLSLDRHLMLGQSKLGILIKLVHPDLIWKRLGRRGHSKTHYIGIRWNASMVDKDVTSLIDVDLASIRNCVGKGKYRMSQENNESQTTKPHKHTPPNALSWASTQKSLLVLKKPLYSFVHLEFKYPCMDCSPRSWKLSPNTIPKHSEWAKLIMERSVRVLKDHNVDLDLLIAKFSTGVYFEDNRSVISDTVMKSVNILLGASSSKNTFLHLYLAIMVLIFPTILASDQEVSVASKMQLRASVNDCIRKLEDEIPTLASVDHRSLIIILRKMIHINEMTSTSVKPCHVVDVFEEMISDTDLISTKVDGSSQSSPLEQLFIKAAINAHNAYNLNTSPISSDARSAENLTHILNIGKTFQQVSLLVTRTIQQIRLGLREEDAGNDVPYQVFLLSTKLFHEITLSFPEIQQLPIPIITFIILCATNEWQNVSFVRYASRGPDLSKETFKSWWVFSSMYQEYISVISELVALSHTLS